MNKRISVLSVPIDCVTMDEAVQRILQLTEQPGLHLVATANAEMVMLANENPTLHTILNDASLVVPDGAGILWAAERQGEQVPGYKIFEALGNQSVRSMHTLKGCG